MSEGHLLVPTRRTHRNFVPDRPLAQLQASSTRHNAISSVRHRSYECSVFVVEMLIDTVSHSWGAGFSGIGNAFEKDESCPVIVLRTNDLWCSEESAYLEEAVLVHIRLCYRNEELYTEHLSMSFGNSIESNGARCIECHRPQGEPHRADCEIGKYTIRRAS